MWHQNREILTHSLLYVEFTWWAHHFSVKPGFGTYYIWDKNERVQTKEPVVDVSLLSNIDKLHLQFLYILLASLSRKLNFRAQCQLPVTLHDTVNLSGDGVASECVDSET
jgi:hypothetical protein